MGDLLIFISLDSNEPVFYCPSCDGAWSTLPPAPYHIDTVHTVAQLSPKGVRLATEAEAAALCHPRPVKRVRYEQWAPYVEAVLAQKEERPAFVIPLVNMGTSPLTVILEPEGAFFALPPNEQIEIHGSGPAPQFAMRRSRDDKNQDQIAFWPDAGNYELFFRGKRVWELLRELGR
jgi:hypothetical protein